MKKLAFDDFQLFARIAAHGSLSAVARERNAPVSQVSRALMRIEAACGARLIHRSTHGLALTAEGEIFLEHCQRIVGALDELEGEFATASEDVSGRVRVAASSAVAQHLILPSLADLGRLHPHLQVDLEVADRLVDLVRDGIDVAIRTATSLPDTMVARRIGDLARALYAAPDYLAEKGTPARVEDLLHHRLITNTAAPQLNRWPFKVDGVVSWVSATGPWRTNDTGMVASMTLQGLGIGRLATVVAEPLVRQGRLVPVLPALVDPQPAALFAVTATARQRLPKIRACIDFWARLMTPRMAP